jgi:antitoxin ParD1/3/4
MITVAISLNDEDQRFLVEAVKSGRYLSESEVVAEALAGFREREAIRNAKLEELRAEVQVGIDQADRGGFRRIHSGRREKARSATSGRQ